MVYALPRELDPLDLEIVERAVQGVIDVIQINSRLVDLHTDAGLELALRRELAEMLVASGVNDADALLDILIEGMREQVAVTQRWFGKALII